MKKPIGKGVSRIFKRAKPTINIAIDEACVARLKQLRTETAETDVAIVCITWHEDAKQMTDHRSVGTGFYVISDSFQLGVKLVGTDKRADYFPADGEGGDQP